MSKTSFLALEQVSKMYDQHLAVNQVSLNIPAANIYGLLGPNGAGKTSIIRMITGITAPDDGKIYFDGEPLSRNHIQSIGYMPEERGLYKKMKVREQITYLLSLRGMLPSEAKKATTSWLDRLGLMEWADRNTNDLSKGMQQKVQFISTVGHEPKLLILDEPFSGLDPVNANLIETEIRRLKDQGTTIIFSTHRLEQVEELCDYIALINRGQLMLEDEITTVRKQFQKNQYQIEFVGDKSVLNQLTHLEVTDLTDRSANIGLTDDFTGKDLMRFLMNSPLEILKFEQHLPRLNDIFIELVSNTATNPIMVGNAS
ncbi:MAG: ATP-binding cassette domain-containing protein [Bacteroidota bacterium]